MRTTAHARERVLAGLLDMTGQVLRCTHVAQSRPVVLAHLRRLFDASGAAFLDPDRPMLMEPGDAVFDGPLDDLPDLYSHYLHEDPGLPHLQRERFALRPSAMTSRRLVLDGELLRSSYYNEVMRPRDMHHGLALTVATDQRRYGVIVLFRGREQAPFDAWEIDAGLCAARVLAGAFGSIARGEQDDAQAPQSLAVLDQRLQLYYRDTNGPAYVTRWLGGGWRDDPAFRPFVARCRAVLDGEPSPRDIMLDVPTADGGRAELSVELRRVARPGSERLVLLLRPLPIACGGAALTLRLSRRERDVAALIAAGASHAEIGRQLALSVHTVAHHAGAVYRKTRVGSRAALAARLSGAPRQPDAIPGLTRRAREIVAMLVEGARNKDIAARLGLSTATVSNHLQKIYRKAEVRGRVALIQRLSAQASPADDHRSRRLSAAATRMGDSR